MRTRINGRQFLLVAILPVAFGLACSKRSGLDRGDANEEVLRRPVASSMETSRLEQSRAAEADGPESGGFAAPPADSPADAPSTQAPAARPAEDEISAPNASADEGLAGARRSQPVTELQSSELGARGDSAYSAKSRQRDGYRPREERPGLGTSWGETRKSWVSTVSFERDNPNAPTATQRIYYNDTNGIMAQTGERSIGTLGPNVTELGRGFVTVEIVDPGGLPLPGLSNGGRSYVVGRDGDRYAIQIRNRERYRVEVVATVDGLDVIDGTTGNFQKRGYVIEPYSTLLIEGFRKSSRAVASFRFGSVSDSYAARTASDRHVGVIGVALFAERGCCVEEYSNSELNRRQTADPFPGQFARPPRLRPNYRAY